MKKKAALLMALVMLFSMLPVTALPVFGEGLPYESSTVRFSVPYNRLTEAQRTSLTSTAVGTLELQLQFNGAVPTGAGLVVQLGGTTVAPSGISVANGNTTVVFQNIAWPTSGRANFLVGDLWVTGSHMNLVLHNPTGATLHDVPANGNVVLINQMRLEGADERTMNAPSITTMGVTNPVDGPQNANHRFYVAFPINQLMTNPQVVANTSTILEFELHGAANNFHFMGDNVGGTGGGAPTIRVSRQSQLFDSHGFIQYPESLFSSVAPGGAWNGMLNVIQSVNSNQVVRAALTASGDGLGADGEPALNSGRAATGEHNHLAGISGVLVLEISGIRPNYSGGRMSIRRIGSAPGEANLPLVTNSIVVFETVGHGINVNGSDPLVFEHALALPQVTVTERRALSFEQAGTAGDSPFGIQGFTARRGGARAQVPGTGDRNSHFDWNGAAAAPPAGTAPAFYNLRFQFLGPRDFIWNVNAVNDGIELLGGFGITSNIYHVNDIHWSVVSHRIDPATGRPALEIWVEVPARTHPNNLVVANFNFNGLALVPIRDNNLDEIEIEVSLGDFDGTTTGLAFTWTPIIDTINVTPPLTSTEMWQLIQIGLDSPDEVPSPARVNAIRPNLDDAVTWQAVFQGQTTTNARWRYRNANWRGNKVVGIRTGVTLELLLREDEPRQLFSGQLNFPAADFNPGLAGWGGSERHPWADHANLNPFHGSRTGTLTISEFTPGAFNTGWVNSIVDINLDNPDGVQFMNAAWRIRSGETARTDWTVVSLFDGVVLPGADMPAATILTESSLRIFVPRIERPRELRHLEVVFWVSTVAGYNELYGGDLSVTVTGNGVEALAHNNRNLVIAEIIDPITVTLDGDLLYIAVGQVMSPTEITPIPDIVIQENRRLAIGTRFTVSLEAYPIAVLGHHALVQSIASGTNGLEVRATRVGTGDAAFMEFEVIRESQGELGEIRLSNNHVIGTFLQGITYGISVNATPVATYSATAALPVNQAQRNTLTRTNPIAQNTARGLTGRGNFDHIPYFTQVVTFDRFIYEGLPPGVGTPGIAQQVRLVEGMVIPHPTGDIADPFRLVNGVGMLSLRAFQVLAGFPEPDWTAPVATITGTGQFGELVTVVVTQGSNIATINGVEHDIASFGTGLSGAPGTIQPLNIDNRIFLPMRFVAEAFGMRVSWDNGVAVLG
jgi:hypothetical protein